MRHNKKFNHLGRQAGHRKAMLANMASSLIMHKRIETTVAKAKAVKMYLEPLVTKSKTDETHQRRMVFSYLKQKEAVTELFRTIAPKIADRPGGYYTYLAYRFRLGDAAEMCIIEFVDFNETYTFGKEASANSLRLSQRLVVHVAKQNQLTLRRVQLQVSETKKPTAKRAPQSPQRNRPHFKGCKDKRWSQDVI